MRPIEFTTIMAAMAATGCDVEQMEFVAEFCKIEDDARLKLRRAREARLAKKEKRLAEKEDRLGGLT